MKIEIGSRWRRKHPTFDGDVRVTAAAGGRVSFRALTAIGLATGEPRSLSESDFLDVYIYADSGDLLEQFERIFRRWRNPRDRRSDGGTR